mmetsp:Transcript_74595/g.139285  ORF Transcript_74595/g.139285 Transcript_74595/m.139285 type:complete len:239 (-) Transcript_74595:322-1038(-)
MSASGMEAAPQASSTSSHGASAAVSGTSAKGREGRPAAPSAASGSGASDGTTSSIVVSVEKRPARLEGNATFKHALFLPQSCRRNTSRPGQSCSPPSLLTAAAGSPSPRSSGSKATCLEKASLATLPARFMRMSPLKTRDRSSATCRWHRSKPLAPPASKAAAMRRNMGSLCSSASRLCWIMFASFFSKVLTPQMRRFLDGPALPSPPSASSSAASAVLLSPPRTLYVSVCTQSTRQA